MREKEKGINGFITIFRRDGAVLHSTSPELRYQAEIPPRPREKFSELRDDPSFEYFIIRDSAQHDPNVEFLSLVGKITPDRYYLIEKALWPIDLTMTLSLTTILYSLCVTLVSGFALAYLFARVFTSPILRIQKSFREC